MASRYHTEIRTTFGDYWRMEIHDADWVGTSRELQSGASDGFTLSYNSNGSKFTSLMPSELRYSVAIKNLTDSLLLNLISANLEGKFTVKVFKDVAGTWTFWWAGVILPDIARYEDRAYPYRFEIAAVCGLTNLQKIEYNNDGEPYEGLTRLSDLLAICIKKIPHVEYMWGSATDFIRTIVDYYENSHTYADSYCPLYYTNVNNRAFFILDSKDNKKYFSAWRILDNLCRMFNCRLYQHAGTWVFEQIDERAKTSFYARQYAYSMGAPTAVDMYGQINIRPSDDHPRASGGTYDWMPALKRVKITYNAQNRRNYIAGHTWDQDSGTTVNAGNVDYALQNTRIRFTGTMTASFQNSGVTVGNYFYPLWRIRIKVGANYLKRKLTVVNNQISAGAVAWSSVVSDYEWTTGILQAPAFGTSVYSSGPIDILTPVLLASGDLEVNVDFDEVFLGDMVEKWAILNAYTEVITDGLAVVTANDVEYEKEADGDQTEEYEFQTLFADGTDENSAGRLLYGTGSGTSDWGIGGGTYDKKLVELLMEELLKSMSKPRKRMTGAVYGADFPIWFTMYDTHDIWAFLGGTYTASNNHWSGTWLKLTKESVATTTIIKYQDTLAPSNAPALPNSGQLGNTGLINLTPATLDPLAAAKTSAVLNAGSIASVPVVSAMSVQAFVSGQILSLVNPANGHSDEVTVTADVADGDTTIAVSGTLTDTYGEGSYIVVKADNYVKQGGSYPTPYLDEDAQDAVGTILVDSSEIDFTYDDATPSITAILKATGVAAGTYNLLTTDAKGRITSAAVMSYLTGNQTITISGDATGSGTTSIVLTIANGAITTVKIADQAVTLAKIVNIATASFLGRTTAGTGVTEVLTATQATALLNLFSSTLKGLVPASGGGTTNFLRADGSWAAPAGGITGTLTAGRVTLSAGASAVTDSAGLTYNSTTRKLTVDTSTNGGTGTSAILALLGAAITGDADAIYASANVSGLFSVILANARNIGNTGDSKFELQVGGTSAGDAFILFSFASGGTNWAMGVDNSDLDKWKLTPGGTRPGSVANKGIIADINGLHGVNLDLPKHAWDVSGRLRASTGFIGKGVQWTSSNIVLGAGAGTGGSLVINSITGCDNFMTITFTTGNSPTAGGVILTATYPNAWPSSWAFSAVVFSADNDQAAADYNNVRTAARSHTSFQLKARAGVSLAANTAYSYNFFIGSMDS